MSEQPRRGEIHLGDLARALDDLPWTDPNQAAAIANCLGFGLAAQPKVVASARSHQVFDRRSTPRQAKSERPSASAPPILMPPSPPNPVPLPAGVLPSGLKRLPTLAPPHQEVPDWLTERNAAFPAEPEPQLARATLLPERTARHVLSAGLATTRATGRIDLGALIDAVCRRQPLRDLPRRREATLDRGCQLLLDYSSSMTPFWEDLRQLCEQVHEVVGAHATRVYSFDTQPTQARTWTPAGEPVPWRPDGRPVLAATDLGIQGRAAAEPNPDWPMLAADCAKAGSPLILLIPWPAERWPRTFAPGATRIHWGPRTTAGMVRRAADPAGNWR
ncbi:hypothetical protein [Rhabdochromatium marinum]|uniref:hypothetical protein n=1 Tax=Rhabdochromatium marinum TaxID=48729 RepID=UPI0019061203|nr:hypothetical protein [Rhabdochromatium marinum]MBK1649580.1 hypothetical protein [Rhabdochromatium marinum]